MFLMVFLPGPRAVELIASKLSQNHSHGPEERADILINLLPGPWAEPMHTHRQT